MARNILTQDGAAPSATRTNNATGHKTPATDLTRDGAVPVRNADKQCYRA